MPKGNEILKNVYTTVIGSVSDTEDVVSGLVKGVMDLLDFDITSPGFITTLAPNKIQAPPYTQCLTTHGTHEKTVDDVISNCLITIRDRPSTSDEMRRITIGHKSFGHMTGLEVPLEIDVLACPDTQEVIAKQLVYYLVGTGIGRAFARDNPVVLYGKPLYITIVLDGEYTSSFSPIDYMYLPSV